MEESWTAFCSCWHRLGVFMLAEQIFDVYPSYDGYLLMYTDVKVKEY